MTDRNLSPQVMFKKLAQAHPPLCRFDGATGFTEWKKDTLPQVLATLGEAPARVPLNPELLVEWDEGALHKQRWVIDVSEFISATLQINIPADLHPGERRPAIMCWHGHGLFGKDSVMGNASSPERRAEIASCNYDYGRQMAEAGYITYAIDWIGLGERNDNNKPHFLRTNGNKDWCNLYYLHATMLGMTSLSINVTHGKAATDFVQEQLFVDADRLGVMGLSGGGTMTLWSSLCDERFGATEIICYSDLWAKFGFNDLNYCGMQVAPGLFKLVDLPDVQGLLAPRPLLVDIGVYDSCFVVDNATACFHQVENIYEAAGARDDLWLDLHNGEHGWGGNKSASFFGQYLGLD